MSLWIAHEQGQFTKHGLDVAMMETPFATDRLLQRLQPIEQTVQGKGNTLQTVVDLLRAHEVSWADVGSALGISTQSAWERFA